MDIVEKIIRDNCWKFDKGYPDSQEDINYLKTLIEQQLSLFSDKELADMVKQDTGVDVEDIDNEAELKITFNKLSPELKKRIGIETPEELQKALNTVLNLRTQPVILQVLTVSPILASL